MKSLFLLFSLLLLTAVLPAQTATPKFTISGTVRDSSSGENMIGALIRIRELPSVGAVTNAYGFYSLTLPEGDYQLVVNYIGYVSYSQPLALHSNQRIDLRLAPVQMAAVVITDKKADENISTPQMGAERLDMKVMSQIPVLLGEKDILKTMQLLPGIKSAGEGNSGFFVRGGAADQNLILLDEAPVYNASHLLGFFSTFNSDAIKDATIYKGNMPAQYGGRLSSVLDLRMNEGNDQHFGVSGGLGVISSRLNVEGPIVKDKASFLVTGRRTYADVFLKLSPDSTINNNTLYFYDLNAKVNWRVNSNNRIYLSGYFGRDQFGFGDQFGFDWGNATGTLRWSHIAGDRLFSNTSLIFSNYSYNINIAAGEADFKISSKIRDWNLKQEWQYYATERHNIRYGANVIHHTMTPGNITSNSDAIVSTTVQERTSMEYAGWLAGEYTVNKRLNIAYGIRVAAFSALGGGTFYDFDAAGNAIDTTAYSDWSVVKNYISPEPRFSASYLLDSLSSIKLGYARNTQFLHLLSNSTSSTPTDIWIPSSKNVKPEYADQVALGWYRNFGKKTKWEFSAETYYKWMQNQIDYRDGAETDANDFVEGELLYGKGRAYGLELLLRKTSGRFTGWVGYTLSRTERKIDGINDNNWFVARQDRTHDISLVGMYELTPRWMLSAAWIYYTGNAVTFPSGKYEVGGQVVFLYTERNGYRMPAYHRLDIGATWIQKKTDRWESSWNFSVYNAYGRENAYTITFRQSETDPDKTEAVQLALFKYIPSVTWNFKF